MPKLKSNNSELFILFNLLGARHMFLHHVVADELGKKFRTVDI